MNINFELENVFIPNWRNNKKLPEEEQIKIHWAYPTYAERKKIIYWTNPKMGLDKEMSKEIEVVTDFDAALRICVSKIDNLNVNGNRIKTGVELCSAKGLAALVEEAGTHITGRMDDVRRDSKN